MRLAALAAAAALLAGCSGGDDEEATPTTTGQPGPTVSQPTVTTPLPPPPAANGSIAAAVERVLPSVVNVQTSSFGGGEGGGSGVIFDRQGLILTNNHVVEGTTSVRVSFNDGRKKATVPAEVIGTEPSRDLAVLRVEARDLVPVQLARSSALRLGDPVIAIGFPLDLGITVTSGIVSGLDRTIDGRNGDLTGLLQTDAAINPGNSGGPLVDRAGRLVGINTAGIRDQGTEGIGFAIAIDGALPVIERLSRGAPSGDAWLGISFGSVDSETAAVQLGLDSSIRGAAVTVVYPGGPGEDAGLAVGDVITVADDVPIRNANALQELLASRQPGDELDLELIDSRGPRLVTVKVARRTPGEVP